jgi:CheY-like chemotaxis protein
MLQKLIKTALILDPNKYQMQLLSQTLQAAGVCSIKAYGLAAEAREALGLLNPCVLFVDSDLPDGDGVSFVRGFRRSQNVRNRKAAVVMTAQGAKTLTVSQSSDAGANALLVKPIAPRQAIMMIKRMMENPRMFVDAATYVGPCRRYGVAAAPTPCPRQRAEDRALERLEWMGRRDEAITTLAREGIAACGGDEPARARCLAQAGMLADVALLLEDQVMRAAADMAVRILADDVNVAIRAKAGILFKALALFVDVAPDDPRRVQLSALLDGLAA